MPDMHTLNIQSIFENIEFYKKNYIQILKNPQQYYQPVEDASIKFSIVSCQALYLGDLLQLWFGHKWTSSYLEKLESLDHYFWYQNKVLVDESFYIYAFGRDKKTNVLTAKVWIEKLNQSSYIQLHTDSLPFYLSFITLDRPDHHQSKAS